MEPYLVIGLGNPLMGDDGAGPRAVELLAARDIPPARLRTMITPGYDLVTYLQDARTVVLVDAADFGGTPGEVRRAEPGQVESTGSSDAFSFHGTDLMKILDFARDNGLLPERTLLYLVQKKDMAPGTGMCPEVGQGVERIVAMIGDEVAGDA